jgi:hypothetical protein
MRTYGDLKEIMTLLERAYGIISANSSSYISNFWIQIQALLYYVYFFTCFLLLATETDLVLLVKHMKNWQVQFIWVKNKNTYECH